MFERLNYEDYCEIVDSEFQVADAGDVIKLKLFEVSEKQESPHNISFSLYLKSPISVFLEQKNYKLRHEKYGEGELFIVPIRQEEDGFVYEAVFNRFIES
jgi:hypothetical protein